MYVKPFVKGQKNDYNDAEAVAEAALRPNLPLVREKTQDLLDLRACHRIRSSSCTSVAASSPSGTLPTRLFDGKAALGTQGLANGFFLSACTRSGLSATQRGIALMQTSRPAGKAGIPLGATEITNNGLSGFIAATPMSFAASPAQGY